uniref:Peptidase A2 domain-containing protein n=1 Tax=Trichuris muris TaxID=70415 RepID=A0A5S6Q0B0_TRIMR
MKSNSKEELEKFFFVVHGIITTLCTKNAAAELESKTSMQILASKLHRNLQSAWAKRVYDLRPRGATLVDFKGCRGKHHSLLHGASRVYAKLGGPHALKPPQPQEHIEDFHVGASAVTPMDCQVLLAVLPAQIVANGRSCKAMVLLDPGSEATLITEELAFRLGLSGPRRRLRFSTFHGRDPTLVSTSVAFRVSSVDGKRSFDVCNAYTVPQLNVSQRRSTGIRCEVGGII